MMASAVWSHDEPAVEVESATDIDRLIEDVESRCRFPVAISVDAHGYRADLLVGHDRSFVHLTPDEYGRAYHVTVGGSEEGGVDFWLQSTHHTWFPARHLVENDCAREAFREFILSGQLSPRVRWEEYYA